LIEDQAMTTKTLTAAVGRGGMNRPQDVRTVQEILNTVPGHYGGPVLLIAPDGVYDFELDQAIDRFQRQALNVGRLTTDRPGLVHPAAETWRKLNELSGQWVAAQTPSDLDLSGLREDILRIARGEMGKVSDNLSYTNAAREADSSGKLRPVRYGWETLKRYLTEALEHPPNWTTKVKQKYTVMPYASTGVTADQIKEKTVEITPLDAVKFAYLRVPTGGKPLPDGRWNGIHWCGIFATWVLRQAGVRVIWGTDRENYWNYGIKNWPARPDTFVEGSILADRTIETREDIQPGDVCVIPENSHHFIVERVEKRILHVIAGNSAYQQIMRERYPIDKVRCTYRTCPVVM
jgi:hypothetical protein